MYRLLLAPLLLLCGTLYAQDKDPGQALQNATTALKAAQNDYDAALKAKLAADKANAATEPAGQSAAAPEKKKLYPIDTDFAVYGDGTVGLDYSYQGKPLITNQDYADVIDALGDTKTSGLLKSSQDKESVGMVSILAGAGFFAFSTADLTTSGFTFGDAPSSTTANVLGIGALALGAGCIVLGVDRFIGGSADFDHAIRRYNKLVAKQNQLSFYFDPNLNKPELGLVQRF